MKEILPTNFPKFPTEIIQGVVKEFVDLYSPIRETPEAGLWVAYATFLGNAISPYVCLDCASSEPRFFSIFIGTSGRTRKSAGANAAADVFQEINQQKIIPGFGSAEGILKACGENRDPQAVILNVDEFRTVAEKTAIPGSIGISALNRLFETHDYANHTARTDVTVRNAYLSLLGSSTPEDYQNTWVGQHIDVGFLNRLLLVGGEVTHRLSRPRNPNPDELRALIAHTRDLIEEVERRPRVFPLEESAGAIWDEFYSDAFTDEDVWTRIDTLGLRLMALQTALQRAETVTKETVRGVIDFLQYEVAVRRNFRSIQAQNPIATMEEKIRRVLREAGTMTRRLLQSRTNANRYGLEAFDRAVENLKKNGELHQTPTKRQSYIYTWLEETPEEDVVGDVVMRSDDTQELRNSYGISGFQVA